MRTERSKISTLIKTLIVGGISGIFTEEMSNKQIIGNTTLFGFLSYPYERYIWDNKNAKKLIPYYAIGVGCGIAIGQVLRYGL